MIGTTTVRWPFRAAGALAVAMAAALAVAQDKAPAGETWKAPSRAARKKNPGPADSKPVVGGRKLYARECRSCHGEKGAGDGSAAKDLERHPGDLTRPEMWEQSDGALYWKLTEGNKPMPTFEKLLTDEERWHVVNYVRTLAPRPGDEETDGKPRAESVPDPAAPKVLRPLRRVPATHLSALTRFLDTYLGIRSALARDDLEAARKGVSPLVDAASRLPVLAGAGVDEGTVADWEASVTGLRKSTEALSGEDALAGLRTAFRGLSESVAGTLRLFGHSGNESLVEYRCEKAFGGKGAVWIQKDREPGNPFLGPRHETAAKRLAVFTVEGKETGGER